jgi:hypothetical protein
MNWCPVLKTEYEITGDCRFWWHQLAFKVVMVHISVVGYLPMKCTISQSRTLIMKYSYNKNIVLLGSWKFLGLVAMSYLAIPLNWQQFLPDNLITKLNQRVMSPVLAGVEHHAFWRDENKLEILENRVLVRVLGHKGKIIPDSWIQFHNKLHSLLWECQKIYNFRQKTWSE